MSTVADLIAIRTCKSCKHRIPELMVWLTQRYDLARCGHPDSKPNAVTGNPLFCETRRSGGFECGPGGYQWEPK